MASGRTHLRHRLAGALVVTLLVPASIAAGCGSTPLPAGDSGDGGCVPPAVFGAPPPNQSIADACGRLFDARAAWESRFILPVATHDRRAMIDSCVGLATLPGSRVTPADIELCIAQLRPGCNRLWNWRPACLGYGWNLLSGQLTGTRAAGAACRAHLQCQSGNCAGAFAGCGRCKSWRRVGEACDPRVDQCDSTATCELGVCVLSGKKLGERCTHKFPECQKTLYCDAGNLCARRVVDGGGCEMRDACDEGLYCRAGTCARYLKNGLPCGDPNLDLCLGGACRAGVCSATRSGLGVGEDCTLDRCAEELSCEMGICMRKSWPLLGEKCGDACSPGLTCEPNDFAAPTGNMCVPLPKPGEPCTRYSICSPDAVCAGFSPVMKQRGTCARKGVAGEPCPCQDELLCASGSCVAYGVAFDCK